MTRFVLLLMFPALLLSCYKDDTAGPNNNNNPSPWTNYSLAGSTWVLTAYHDTVMTSNITANDTLVFTDSTHYTWNGVACTYSYYTGSGATNLILYNTPFGDLGGAVPYNFETYGLLNGVRFSSLTGVWYMWFERQ